MPRRARRIDRAAVPRPVPRREPLWDDARPTGWVLPLRPSRHLGAQRPSVRPGTMARERTSQTPGGWLMVRDFLAVGPWDRTSDRSALHRRTSEDFDALIEHDAHLGGLAQAIFATGSVTGSRDRRMCGRHPGEMIARPAQQHARTVDSLYATGHESPHATGPASHVSRPPARFRPTALPKKVR